MQYAAAWRIVGERVRPKRELLKGSKPRVAANFWLFEYEALSLREKLSHLDWTICVPAQAKYLVPAQQMANQVFAQELVVFPQSSWNLFGVLASHLHWRWVLRYTSTLETRTRYNPSDVFTCYPFPPERQAIARIAEKLSDLRSNLIASRGQGITGIYNAVNDPVGGDAGVEQLRQYQVKLDKAVRDAYGWQDLDLEHGFHPVRGQGIRYTFSPEAANEVLERLLELNKERYDEEVAKGLHGENRPRSTRRRATTDAAPSLFDAAADDTGEDV